MPVPCQKSLMGLVSRPDFPLTGQLNRKKRVEKPLCGHFELDYDGKPGISLAVKFYIL
ncbi:MAG: hypothetical protein AB2728_06080 [Candidatus Thiodiazotropha sp.]|nr:hypothetical protein [Candidatus Thiodiazotropha taylori]MBT3058418.1 hypothetical protein [Candidatus Thiodiazotropha sp. (ex Lucina pensylvanica)]MBV2094367.1 hypothetical protein [Candidatus Thiodiazotropha sp. (ex Codakia orbicularis)]